MAHIFELKTRQVYNFKVQTQEKCHGYTNNNQDRLLWLYT